MNYIYDILLNFQDEYYDFFEWNMEDKIIHIKKTPIIKISNDALTKIKKDEIKFSEVFLHQIYNKTQIFNKYDIKFINYICLFCNDNEVIGVKLNKKGLVIGKSSLLLDEGDKILDMCENLEIDTIQFSVNKKNKPLLFQTRNEIKESQIIIKKLHNLYKSGEVNKLNYLFFECFGKKEEKINKVYKRLKNEVYKFSENYHKINDFLKIISQK